MFTVGVEGRINRKCYACHRHCSFTNTR